MLLGPLEAFLARVPFLTFNVKLKFFSTFWIPDSQQTLKKLRFGILWFASCGRWNCSKEFWSFLKTKSKFVKVRNFHQDSLFLDATHLIQLIPYSTRKRIEMDCCDTNEKYFIVTTINPIWHSHPVHHGTKFYVLIHNL